MKNVENFDYNKKCPNFISNNTQKNNQIKSKVNNIQIEGETHNQTNLNQNQSSNSQNEIDEEHNNSHQYDNNKTLIENADLSILPESEMLLYPDYPPQEKETSEPFGKSLLKEEYNNIKKDTPNEIIAGVENCIDNIMQEVKDSFMSDELKINKEKSEINKLVSYIERENKKQNDIENAIKKQKIKDLEDTKMNIQKKLIKLEENLKIIDNNKNLDNNTILVNPTDQIEENIKKAQLKEIKTSRDILGKKLNGIEEQIQNLMQNEEEMDKMKRVNIKQFLENFERDKLIAEERAARYQEEMKQREQKIMTSIMRAKERKEKEIDLQEKEEEEKRKKLLEKIRLRELEKMRERNKENQEKLNYIKNHVNDKPANENEYLFKVLENEYKLREENNIKKEILKHKARIKEGIVTLEEIEEFKKKQRENELKREAEVDEERKKLKEQWRNIKENLPKFESSAMQKLKEEEQKSKEQKEMEDFRKKVKMKEIKNYSEIVNKMFLPKIDQNVKKEREERIKNLTVKNNIQKHKRKHNRILLVKRDPNKPRKYNWDVKLNPMNEDNSMNGVKGEQEQKRPRTRSAKQKIPLEKRPDYLTEMRIRKMNEERNVNSSYNHKRSYDWEKMIKNNKGTLVENVEQIKIKAKQLEEKAKMKEKLLHINGEVNVEMQENVSNLLIDAINAKLAILENIKK